MFALMGKWVVYALEPGESNLQIMLRHRLRSYQPYTGGNWPPNLLYLTLQAHSSRRGSISWNRESQAWKVLVKEVRFEEPRCFDEVLATNLWWTPGLSVISPEISKTRAAALARRGMVAITDIWENGRLISAETATVKFGLAPQETAGWNATFRRIPRGWQGSLNAGQEPLNL